jgi:hypothetical protein
VSPLAHLARLLDEPPVSIDGVRKVLAASWLAGVLTRARRRHRVRQWVSYSEAYARTGQPYRPKRKRVWTLRALASDLLDWAMVG